MTGSRTITTAVVSAAAAEVVIPISLVKLDFSPDPVVANTGVTTITYAGDDYLGVGNLGKIDLIEEGAELQMYGITLAMTGIPNEFISLALSNDYQGRDAFVYLALLDSNHQLIADPVLVFDGRMDFMDVEMGSVATITVTAESKLVDWDRPRIRRYNDADQQDRYAGDLGMQFVEETVEKELTWGRT